MDQKNFTDLLERYAASLLAFVPALIFLFAAVVFALFLSTASGAENSGSFRWFAYSAFPLGVVVSIAVLSRIQRYLEQRYGK